MILQFIWKKEFLLLIYRKICRFSLFFFDWLDFIQCPTSFSSIDHLLCLYAWFLIFHGTQMSFSLSTHLVMCLSLETSTSIIRTDEPILVELIDLVNSVVDFLCQMANFPTWILDYDSHSSAFLDFFLSFDNSICSTMAFPPLGNFDVAVSVSIDFLLNLKGGAFFIA